MNSVISVLNTVYKNYYSQRLRVLAYHDVPDKLAFEKQLKFLKENYTVISIQTLEDHLYLNKKLPKNAVLITFDDGDYTVLKNGSQVLQTLGLPSVLFVITKLIDSSNAFWWKQVEENAKINGDSFEDGRKVVNKLKLISNKEREEYLQKMKPVSAKQLSFSELKVLQQSGMFIANHTHTHPMVDNCSEEELRKEFVLSKAQFKKWNLPGFHYFAYPNGNWDSTSEKLIKEQGIKLSFLFDHKLNDKNINPLRISRLRINTYSPLSEFKLKVSGLHSILMHTGITRMVKK